MEDIGLVRAYRAPLILLTVALAVAGSLGLASGVRPVQLFWPYVSAWASVTLVCLLAWMLVETIKFARVMADRPLLRLAPLVIRRVQLAALPALIFPLFLGAYTWAKSSIPYLVGYPWERAWADADRWILGVDAWRMTHAMLPPSWAGAVSVFYAVVWGFALVFSGALIFAFDSRQRTTTFFTALMLSWLAGGVGLAYLLSAAGPVFAGLYDPDMAVRFDPLNRALRQLLGQDDLVLTSQRYLAAAADSGVAAKGGGISAMPSMHIATATTILLAGWHCWWRGAALLFLALTFFGSVYLGYHYVLDAPVGALVALLCWRVARRVSQPGSPAEAVASAQPAR